MAVLDRASDRLELMKQTRSVAILGMSANPSRASHFVATYLNGKTDWTVYYVNPNVTEVSGSPVYPSLAELPEVPDLVDVFRRWEDLVDVARDTVGIGARAMWLQLGLVHDEAAAIASDAGLDVVQNRCLKVEHARFAGGLHTAGFDTGVIDSRRTYLI